MSYRTVMAADLQGYGSAPQNVQHVLQENLVGCLRDAAANAGLDAARWEDQGSGDGKLMVLPQGVAVEVLADRFVRELNAALRARNRVASAAARTRMRLAIHHGPVAEAANGYSGSAPVVVTRLCNGSPLRDALDAAGADLGVIVSAFVFRGSIEAGMTSLDPADLRRVHLRGLGDDSDAWLWLPGGPDPHTLRFADGLTAGREAPDEDPPPQDPAPQDPAPEDPPPGDGAFRGAAIHAPGATFIGRDQKNYYGGRP
ncbi:hypothetical protein ACH35V_23300 [Actinomadura sp. 1N219]|uniref:hypothetical protein n=1 Tax=Actinomadura sp. 1N219 TaxID=3375152 RepID=UPI0037B9CDE2